MKEILKHFGQGFLAGAPVIIFITVFVRMMQPDGVMQRIVYNFMKGITG